MATRFLTNDVLWREIQTRAAKGKSVRAAVAYFGGSGAKLLALKKGDSIVLDMSISAVRQGVTNPRAVRTLFVRGVKCSVAARFTRNSL